MDGQFGLTEEMARAYQRQRLAEAARERAAQQAMCASTSRGRLVLRVDISGELDRMLARQRDVTLLLSLAKGVTITGS